MAANVRCCGSSGLTWFGKCNREHPGELVDIRVAGEIGRINDRIRRDMPLGRFELILSDMVSSSQSRAEIITAVRRFESFDPELDLDGDHAVGIVVVADSPYIFRFEYGDERYDYSREIGRRILRILHISEFRSIRLSKAVKRVQQALSSSL